MLKSMLAGLAALTLVGTGLATAQSAPPADAPRYRPTPEDSAALTDARIAALKTGLKLTADQEKNWPAVETALRALAKQRADRVAERQAQPRDNARQRPDMIARLRTSADAMTARAAALKQLADAAEPLYRSLDDGQKHRLTLLLRAGQGPGLDRRAGPRWQRRT